MSRCSKHGYVETGKRVSLTLSREALAALDELATTRNQTRSNTVEALTLRERKRYARRRKTARSPDHDDRVKDDGT